MKKLFLFFLFSSLIIAQDSNLKNNINKLLEDNFFKSSQIAISVYDLEADSLLYSKDENLLLHPASNMKVLTSVAALYFLGDSAYFQTGLYYTGVVKDSILWGDLIVKGGCDTDFSSDDLNNFSKALKSLGVKKIHGNLLGDISMLDSLYWGKGWMWDDNPYTSFPWLTPLILDKNLIGVIYNPLEIHKPLEINLIPENDIFSVENNSKVIVKDENTLSIKRDWINNKNKIIVNGEIPYLNFADTTYFNLVDANRFFLDAFKNNLISNGIKIEGILKPVKEISDTIHLITSNKNYVKEMMINMNKKSDNLSAEMLLRLLGTLDKSKSISADDGIKYVDSLISIASPESKNFRIVDGSGVSHYNLVTAKILNDVINFIYKKGKGKFEVLKRSLPVAGIDGSLKNRMTESIAKGRVFAKTGTLSGVSTLTGYAYNKKGHLISFSILIQNYVGSSHYARNIQDKICEIICESE